MNFLNVKEVSKKIGLSIPTIYRRIKKRKFPAPRNTHGKAVRWFDEDIEEWMKSCLTQISGESDE